MPDADEPAQGSLYPVACSRVRMSTNVVMPQMGESVAEGTVVRWIKKVGDLVDRDEPLFEISTDKVDAEIPSPAAGTLLEIRVHEGDTVPIDTVVAVLGGDAAAGRHGVQPRHVRAGPRDGRQRRRGAAARTWSGGRLGHRAGRDLRSVCRGCD
jgi:pyruvate dehydrogenase E2 component (dihydrolipoamide acetyltransferase)